MRLSLLLLLGLAARACADKPLNDGAVALATPLFAWTPSAPYFASDPSAALQAFSDLHSTLGDIIEGVLRPSVAKESSRLLDAAVLEESTPEVVLVVLGSELRTSDLRRKHASVLQSLVEGAKSSLSLPYVMHPVTQAHAGTEDLQQAIQSRLPKGDTLQTVGCGEGHSLDAVADVLRGGSHVGARVLLGCTGVPETQRGSKEGVEEELRQVKAAHDAAAALGRRQVTLYAVQPQAGGAGDGGAEAQQRRRTLLATEVGQYNTCDALCRVQVKWLEGMLALLIIIIASLSGMCCLGVLDTPTRFESPKDSQRTD